MYSWNSLNVMVSDHNRLCSYTCYQQFPCMTGCERTTVVRVAAAVYEALGPALEEIQKDMKNVKNDINTMKSDLASLTHRVDNLTEEVDTRLSSLIEFMRDDFSGVERELSGLNSTTNMICEKIEEHDNQITNELMKINETLTDHIISNA